MAQFVPDISGPLSNLLGGLQTRAGLEDKRQARQAVQGEIDILSSGVGGEEEEAALVRLSALNPKAGNAIRQALERGDVQELAAANEIAERGFKQALFLQNQKNFAAQKNALISLGQAEAAREGGDPTEILKLLDLPEEQLKTEIQRMLTMGADVKTLTERTKLAPGERLVTASGQEVARGFRKPGPSRVAPIKAEDFTPESLQKFNETGNFGELVPVEAPADPVSVIGKINSDFDKGLITAEQRDAGIEKATRGREPLVEVKAFEKESARLGARSDALVRDEIRGNARTASRQLGKVRSLSKLLETTGTGALTQFLPQIGRLIPGFDATNEQAAQAQINSFVLDEMSKFKGNTSDRELAFARETVAELGNSPEANRIILRNFENVIFLSSEENRQFDEFVKGGNKARDFIFNFQKVIIPDHPTFGNVTLDDLQTTAFENGITIENALKELRNR